MKKTYETPVLTARGSATERTLESNVIDDEGNGIPEPMTTL